MGFAAKTCNKVTVKKRLDKASPKLSAVAVSGRVFDEIILAATTPFKGDPTPIEYLRFTLQDVTLVSLAVTGATTGLAAETVTHQPKVILMDYVVLDDNDRPHGVVREKLTCSNVK